MKIKSLIDLLAIDKETLKKYNIDQLRLILGVTRYFVRSIEREINRRETALPEKNLQFL